ncbi:MAG TPA: OB-fold nucleic acid binding domain-containing protein [Candidatus Binatia bacterium]|nr:OB-fold nucleic acid binding domain-containing protein [Candidatus Binatia bacterium]
MAPTSPEATQLPTTSPSPAPASAVSVAAARAAPNGTLVTVEATALTGSDFHDGGGFVADASGGIAVLVEDGSFARGSLLRVTGAVEDRFAQRTIRARGSDVASLGAGGGAAVTAVSTGSVDESTEGRLVRVAGIVRGSPVMLAAGTAHDLDDGTGTVRVIVSAASGIDSSAWAGARVELVGVAGQRDATGSGSSGYRVMPRDVDDVIGVGAVPASPSPSASPGPSATPTAPAQAGAEVVSISAARSAPKNERVRVRGVVTMPTGIVDPLTAVVQDDTAAIVLRLGSDAGDLVRGERIEAGGTRSTLSGMETVRVDGAPLRLGTAAEPVPRAIRTGDAGEAVEAALVSARGALVAASRRASSGTVTFEIDDGSGPLRVSLDASIGFESEPLDAGTLVEVRGVLGQETSGVQPLLGYRIWPRSADDVRVIAIGEIPASTTGARDEPADPDTSAVATGSLGAVGGMDLAGLRVAATLVVGPWAELGVGGLLWDGERLVAVHAASSVLVAALGARAPIALELAGLRAAGTEPSTGVPLVVIGSEPDGVQPAGRPPAPPSTALGGATDRAVWISLVGRLADGGRSLAVDGEVLPLEHRCDEAPPPGSGIVGVTAVALGDPARLIAPCGGIRAAPAVGRPGGRASLPPRATVVPATPPAAEDGRRGVVAGMFVLSAAMLGGAAVARRRSVPRDGIDRAELGTDAAEGSGAPHLTLMSVRRERGP